MIDILLVIPVIDYSVRGLCRKPYPLHPKGCPNFNKCDRCPPKAPFYDQVYDLTKPVYAVVNEFDLAGHVERMKIANPTWSERQLYCVLYWQNTARKQLESKITRCLVDLPGYMAERTPEAMGVNITATLLTAIIGLEWPPRRFAKQVALLGVPLV